MDVCSQNTTELHFFGSKIRYGCSRQRPTIVGRCFVQTICGKDVLDEPMMNYGSCVELVNRIVGKYMNNDFVVRHNKCSSKLLYNKTIIDALTRSELFSIKIIEA